MATKTFLPGTTIVGEGYTVKHFRNAAMRAKFNRGEVTEEKAMADVRILRGAPTGLLGYMRSQAKRLAVRG